LLLVDELELDETNEELFVPEDDVDFVLLLVVEGGPSKQEQAELTPWGLPLQFSR
jgi:hypothetical protein